MPNIVSYETIIRVLQKERKKGDREEKLLREIVASGLL